MGYGRERSETRARPVAWSLILSAQCKGLTPAPRWILSQTLTPNIPIGMSAFMGTQPSLPASPAIRVTSRTKLLDQALSLVREQGFAAMSVENLCRAAGVTKGAFFHHFASKEELGVEATRHWSSLTTDLLVQAPWRDLLDPLDRVLAYIDLRRALLTGEIAGFTCFAGTLVQEAYASSEAIRVACDQSISDGARLIEADVAQAMKAHGIVDNWNAESLALHVQAVLQGAFVLAKAKGGAAVAIGSIDHLRRYVELLFGRLGTPIYFEGDQS